MRIAFLVKDDFNLGVAYVIAYLKKVGHEVRLFLENKTNKATPFRLREFKPDLVCFSCVTANYEWALSTARTISDDLEARILFGGVHPTLCPEDFEGFEVCIGGGEEYFGGKFEPDKVWADREIFFEQLPPVHRRYQIFMTGFGCPFRCSFCNNHQLHRKLIRRDAYNCILELEHLKKRGLRYVLFDDDIFTINPGWLDYFLHHYTHRISLPFTCFGHAHFLDEKTCKILKESGCECVWLGIQNGNEDIRKKILNRQETNEDIASACRRVKNAGMKLMVDHIFGLPCDNKIPESYEFFKSLKPDVVNCYELLYFPKAEINKYGFSKARYQLEGGLDYQHYAKDFVSIPLVVS